MRRITKKLSDRLVANWLILMAFLVIAMIVVGGATRLTDSGLSIAHWSPIHGIIPPLSQKDWNDEFALYKTIPQFKLINSQMGLDDFKFIFWWEWSHRLLGRIVGIFYLLPLIYFWVRGYLSRNDIPMLVSIVLLIGLQGFLGWWMVSSGLSGNRIYVESIRLATHLGMAFFLLALLINAAHYRLTGEKYHLTNNPWNIIIIIAFLQILLGAMVAGTRAGLVHNDWPLIDGKILPDAYFQLKPIWINFIENTQNIQFNHRITGYILGIIILLQFRTKRKIKKPDHNAWRLRAAFMILVQIGLGVFTLHMFTLSPPPTIHGVLTGVLHQLSGAITFSMIVLAWKTYPNYRS